MKLFISAATLQTIQRFGHASLTQISATADEHMCVELEVSTAPEVEGARGALLHAQEWIGHHPHGDNCFISRHYAGDPGDRCNCGKDSVLASIENALARAALSEKGEAAAQVSDVCARCGGTGFVDDGEITGSGDVEFENGPVQCVKDCPACAASTEAAAGGLVAAGTFIMKNGRWTEVSKDVPGSVVLFHQEGWPCVTPLDEKRSLGIAEDIHWQLARRGAQQEDPIKCTCMKCGKLPEELSATPCKEGFCPLSPIVQKQPDTCAYRESRCGMCGTEDGHPDCPF